MAPLKVDDEHLLDRLTEVFRVHGYEGASLSRIAEATGLQRSSLYHRFPGGKTDMVEAVLQRAGSWLEAHVLGPLSGPGTPRERVLAMTTRLAEFYGDGGQSCLLDTLSLGDEGTELKSHVDQALKGWITALSKVARDSGLERAEARQRAEDAMVLIQGALVFSRATGNTKPFGRVLQQLPELLSPGSRD
jgi:TetR/AcrR family transcriptional repressor of lmrAB and yxaGH operons